MTALLACVGAHSRACTQSHVYLDCRSHFDHHAISLIQHSNIHDRGASGWHDGLLADVAPSRHYKACRGPNRDYRVCIHTRCATILSKIARVLQSSSLEGLLVLIVPNTSLHALVTHFVMVPISFHGQAVLVDRSAAQ